MDILGKVYRDYFCKTLELDGNSHLLKNSNFGGIFNLINELDIIKLV